jgi:tetratricopeptide (TPR) repeat protein
LKTLFATTPPDSALKVAARAASIRGVPTDQAQAVLRAAAARHPDDFDVQFRAGERAYRTDPAAAVGYLRAAHALRPDNVAVMHGLASALSLSGMRDEAVALYLRVIELDPAHPFAYVDLAEAVNFGADSRSAVAYFTRRIAEQPGQATAHFGLGMALRNTDPPRAADAFRRSLELDETNALAHNYLGYVLAGRAPRAERIRCFRRAIELDPDFAYPHFNLAGLLVAERDVPGAVAEFRKAIALFPDHTLSHFELARVLAARHLRRVLEIDPGFGRAYPLLAQVLLRTNDTAGAIEVLRAAVERFPLVYDGYDSLMQALMRHGSNVEAVRVYQVWPVEARQRLRYNAACAAALAAGGAGRDAPPAADRPAYRRLAYENLAADLDVTRKLAAVNKAYAHQWLTRWLADADLASVRDPAALDKLPPDLRADWVRLWAEVRALHAATAPPERAPPPRAIRS